MRKLTLAAALLAVGCAGQPDKPAADPSPAAAAGAGATATPAPATAPKIDAQRLADARRLGYKIVDKNGEEYFCDKSVQTGSHLHQETICLTAAQMDSLRSQTQQNLQNMMRTTPPPAGR
jgi:hypothetical protein